MQVDCLFIMLARSQSIAETMFIGFLTFICVSIFFALPGWIRNSGKKNWDEISKKEKNQKNDQNSDWDDTNN